MIRTICAIIGLLMACAQAYAAQGILRSDERMASANVAASDAERFAVRAERDVYVDRRFTGEQWNSLNRLILHGDRITAQMGKLALVRGVFEGAWTMDAEKTNSTYIMGVRYGEFVEILDSLYSDQENVKIPVAEALKLATMKLKNQEPEASDKAIELRAQYESALADLKAQYHWGGY